MLVLICVHPMMDIRLPIPGIMVGKALSAQRQILWKFHCVKTNDSPFCLMAGFVEGFHNWSVMSSFTGPSLGPKLPRMILPMEVIMVSRYTSPVVLSFTTRLEMMLIRPGLNAIPMDICAHKASPGLPPQVLVFSSRVVSPVKPQGSVGSLNNASALAGGGDFGGNEAFGGLDGGLMEVVWVD